MTAGYNVLSDHDDVFAVPELMTSDKPLYVGMTDLGDRWAYTVATGPYESDVQYEGDDLRGPETGSVSAADMVASLLDFLSAYSEGDMRTVESPTELWFDGSLVATGDTAEFIAANGGRLGAASSDLEEGYLTWHDDTAPDSYISQDVYRSYWTGKEPE